jgi:hypothetical protein
MRKTSTDTARIAELEIELADLREQGEYRDRVHLAAISCLLQQLTAARAVSTGALVGASEIVDNPERLHTEISEYLATEGK